MNIVVKKQHIEFVDRAHPVAWYEMAKTLHESALKLYQGRGAIIEFRKSGQPVEKRDIINRPVFLLSGFAMENIIKAYCIYENPSYIENGRLDAVIKTHKIASLRLRCKTVPSPKRQQWIFETLEKGLNSWARYPCGTHAGMDEKELHASQEFWEQYLKSFRSHSERLEKLLKKKWKDPYGNVTYCSFYNK